VRILKTTLLAIFGVLACSSADATGFTTISQGFGAFYAEHGSSGYSYIDQYAGPLRLYSVKIEWSGYITTGYDHSYASWPYDDTPYPEPFTANLAYGAWGEDANGNFGSVGDGASYAGITDCSALRCSLSFSASGVDIFSDTTLFVGSGQLVADIYGDINPSFNGMNFDLLEVGGTVTYYLGPVPEPASWALMLGGFGMVGGAMRSRRKAAVTFA